MNQDQFLGMLRNLIAFSGGIAIGHGWLNSEQVTLIGGAIAAVAPVIWTYFVHTDSAKIAAVTALPDVSKVVVKLTAAPDSAAAVAAADNNQPKVTAIISDNVQSKPTNTK